MSLFNFLTKTYGYNKPILANEVEYENYPKQQIYKELSELCKAKKIVRLERGVYFIPKKTKFGTLIFNTLTAIEKKYICDNEEIFGYYSGTYMQYQLGLTKVKPKTINIYTNIDKKRSRTVTIAGQRISLRSARTKIDKHNATVLCFLELMNGIDIETLDEYKRKLITDYITENRITQKQITKYIPYFPDKTCRNLIESEVIYRVPQ